MITVHIPRFLNMYRVTDGSENFVTLVIFILNGYSFYNLRIYVSRI